MHADLSAYQMQGGNDGGTTGRDGGTTGDGGRGASGKAGGCSMGPGQLEAIAPQLALLGLLLRRRRRKRPV
jgi:hypothetical protein